MSYLHRGHGGRRKNAGRPRSGKYAMTVRVTDPERKAVLRFIETMRDGSARYALPADLQRLVDQAKKHAKDHALPFRRS